MSDFAEDGVRPRHITDIQHNCKKYIKKAYHGDSPALRPRSSMLGENSTCD